MISKVEKEAIESSVDRKRPHINWIKYAMSTFITLISAVGLFFVIRSLFFTEYSFQESENTGVPDDEPKTFEAFSVLYEQEFGGRKPPQGLQEWFKYAVEQKCHTHPRYFVKLQEDLEPFRKLIIARGGRKLNVQVMKQKLEGKTDRPELIQFSELGGNQAIHDDQVWGVAHGIFKKLGRKLTLVLNHWDEPISVFDGSDKISQNDKYQFGHEAAMNEQCFADNYGQIGDYKSKLYASPYILAPASFPAVNYPIPAISNSKPPHCFGDLIGATTRTAAFVAEHEGAYKKGPFLEWSRKTETVMFRGKNTGGNPDMDAHYPIEWHPRHRMIEWKERSALKDKLNLNVFLTGHANLAKDESINARIKSKFPASNDHFLTLPKQFSAKYQLVIDGQGWPNRTSSFLLANSVVLLMTVFRDWVVDQLTPMVHYVPVKPDFSDIDEKLEWLMENQEEAKKIAEQGRAYTLKFLRVQDMAAYSAFQAIELAELVE